MEPSVVLSQEFSAALEIAMSRWAFIVAGAIYFLLRLLSETPLNDMPWYRRWVLPFLPEVLGVGIYVFAPIPGVEEPWLIRAALGLWCAYLAQKFRKFLGQTVLGDDPQVAARLMAKLEEEVRREATDGEDKR